MIMDCLSPEQRHWAMSRVKGKDTRIEIQVRKYLFSKGFRFRKNDKRYPGKPDIVLPRYKTVIFVNGCFWHQHPNCSRSKLPVANADYWKKKLQKNVANDQMHKQQLEEMGWQVIVLWECKLKANFSGVLDAAINNVLKVMKGKK